MPALPSEAAEGAQNVEWSETLHSWLFRAQIFLKRYWWIYFITVSAGVGWQAYIEYHRAPSYVSYAQLMVAPRVFGGPGANVSEEMAAYYATNIAIMNGSAVQDNARNQVAAQHPEYEGRTPPVAFSVSQMASGAAILQLSAVGPDAEYTRLFLDAVIESFLDFKKNLIDKTIKNQQDRTLKLVLDYEERVKQSEDKKLAFLRRYNIVSVQNQKQAADAKDASLTVTAEQLQSQLKRLQAAVLEAYVQGDGVDEVDQLLAQPGAGIADESYFQAKRELRAAEARWAVFRYVWREAHPRMQELNGRLAQLRSSLDSQRAYNKLGLERWRADLERQLQNVTEERDATRAAALKFSETEGEYGRIMGELDLNNKMLNELLKTVQNLDIGSMAEDSFDVHMHATAAVPMTVNKVKQIGTGAFVGFVLGTVLIFLLGVLDGRVMSVEDVTQRFDEPMLGIIPMQRRIAGEVELLKSNDQRLMFAESCRNIRSSLLYMDRQGQRPRTVVLTSSIPAEGKSTISSNLAITLGFAASRTLLVDADLRRGALHKRFGLKNDVGLAEHIQDNVPIDQVIQRTNFENLDFIPCGRYPNQPGELLMSERFRETVRELKNRYDFIIFDSPPILATDDAASFATRTDAVLFVIRAGYTRLRQIRASLENLQRRGVPVYGIVVNFIDHREPGYYSYKYYDYYSYRTPAQTP